MKLVAGILAAMLLALAVYAAADDCDTAAFRAARELDRTEAADRQ